MVDEQVLDNAWNFNQFDRKERKGEGKFFSFCEIPKINSLNFIGQFIFDACFMKDFRLISMTNN